MTDTDLLASAIRSRFGRPEASRDSAWQRPPAVKVVDCVLSLGRRYDGFVVPRLRAFSALFPHVHGISALAALIASYDCPHGFVVSVLDYRHAARAETLAGVIRYLQGIIERSEVGSSEEEVLRRWACSVLPSDHRSVGVRGFGLAGFQYLRMLFGADTAKPDVHIIRFVSDAVGRKISQVRALELLEASAPLVGARVRDIDTAIWEGSARRQWPLGTRNRH